MDSRNEKVGYKIRDAQLQKIPYMLVVGRGSRSGMVAVGIEAAATWARRTWRPSAVADEIVAGRWIRPAGGFVDTKAQAVVR